MIVLLGVDKPNETFMTLVCPICKSSVQELPSTGDATGYHCATHGCRQAARRNKQGAVLGVSSPWDVAQTIRYQGHSGRPDR